MREVRKRGRPFQWDRAQAMERCRQKGWTLERVAREFGVTKQCVWGMLRTLARRRDEEKNAPG